KIATPGSQGMSFFVPRQAAWPARPARPRRHGSRRRRRHRARRAAGAAGHAGHAAIRQGGWAPVPAGPARAAWHAAARQGGPARPAAPGRGPEGGGHGRAGRQHAGARAGPDAPGAAPARGRPAGCGHGDAGEGRPAGHGRLGLHAEGRRRHGAVRPRGGRGGARG
ncbi:unnamed protein product, partial [Prorocentrum cordatum]